MGQRSLDVARNQNSVVIAPQSLRYFVQLARTDRILTVCQLTGLTANCVTAD